MSSEESFSYEEDSLILFGNQIGYTDREIADQLFIAISLVRERRQKLKAPPRKANKEFVPTVFGKWAPIEDTILLRERTKKNKSFAKIGEMLGRTGPSTESRYRLITGLVKKRGKS